MDLFVVLGCISLLWVLAWFWYFRDNPSEHKDITKEELEKLPPYGVAKIKKKIPWKRLTLRILPVTLTYFCYGWTLWLLLNWLPSFFKEGYHLDLKSSALFTFGVFAGGVVGDTLGGVISDRILHKTGNVKLARLSVIL